MTNNPRSAANTRLAPLKSAYNQACIDLLAVMLFGAINIVLLLTGNFTYFLFSPAIPYLLVMLGMSLCGMMPEEMYEGGYGAYEFFDTSVFAVLLTIAVVILLCYLVFFLLARKDRVAFLIAALAFFAADTVVFLVYYGIQADAIIDLIFHAFVIFVLSRGIHAHFKMKKLLAEAPEGSFSNAAGDAAPNAEAVADSEDGGDTPDTPHLRVADFDVKSRTLLECETNGRKILYRRVKRTNELVIGNYVYDEYIALAEMPHILVAYIDGHEYAAGTDETNHKFITFDGEPVIRKIRWI